MQNQKFSILQHKSKKGISGILQTLYFKFASNLKFIEKKYYDLIFNTFKYLTNKERILDKDPTIGLETPKQEKRLPKYLSITESQELLDKAKSGDIYVRKRSKELSPKQQVLATRDFAIITLFLNY